MKSSHSLLRSFGTALLIAGAFSCASTSAHADVLVSYWPGEVSDFIWQPHDYVDEVLASNVQLHGSLTGSPTNTRIRNWGTTMNDTDYVGFTLTAQPGFMLTLTDMTVSTTVSAGTVTDFRWGYRVNEGSGFGAWTFGATYSVGDAGFAYVGPAENEKFWDFADFSTTGTVEFGLFAQAPVAGVDASILISQPANLSVNGSASAVPEPSTYALIAIAGTLALVIARRRKASAKF